ncbi:MAG: hypothetical protein NTY88_00550 [Bacteroidetes bacterium]|nr:hypothetical protein [Bacteroidota bacterium]
MENKHLRTSMRMAIAFGILLPLAETVRRIHEVLAFENFFRWFDDYTLGAVLLCAAFLVWKQKQNATLYLIAAWGTAAGGLTGSLYGQFDGYFKSIPDAGIFSSGFVLIAKALILFYILIGLQKSIQSTNTN